MTINFKQKTAVLTGAGSGFGLEMARLGAQQGMNLVLADVQQDALAAAAAEAQALGAQVLAMSTCSTEFTDARTILLAWMTTPEQ